jgi:hypothetical protein
VNLPSGKLVEIDDFDNEYLHLHIGHWCKVTMNDGNEFWGRLDKYDKYGVWVTDEKGLQHYVRYGEGSYGCRQKTANKVVFLDESF